MKYILMMNAMTTGPVYAGVSGWQAKDIQAHTAFLKNLSKSLVESGELVSTEGLSLPGQAKIVRAGKDGEPITDGMFPETKEFLAGYWIVDVESAERAYQIAAKASVAPGPGGVPLHMPIEVRQVMSRCPEETL
ncbi:MAG TPA: YciI family protein [Bryobacteraceae bacterium]|nr:YciI family protein [Bryobacteraceae bacterium]